MRDNPWLDRVRERLAAEGRLPSSNIEALEEIADHLQDLHRTAIAEGSTPARADALVEAELIRIGSLATVVAERAARNERAREHAHADPHTGLIADLRYALNSMRLQRGFAAVVVVTLAIGIGACTAVFSIINAMLWRSLPYPNPEQLVILMETGRDNRPVSYIVSYPNYADWKRASSSFAAMGLWEFQSFNIASATEPEQVQGARATASLFDVTGVPPALGRVFTAAEEGPGHRLAVISDAAWRTHFAARESAIGETLRLNGEPYEVIGVMPPGFAFPSDTTDVWVPIALTEQDRQRGSQSFWAAARLKPQVSHEAAQAEIEHIGRALRIHPENEDEGVTITPMAEQGLGRVRPVLTAVMGAVSLILVIACVNIANLQLGRALTRRREFVVRLSLGASLRRLARQLFAESLVLAAAGAAGGVALAWMAARAADVLLAPGFRALPYRGNVPIVIDERVLAFAAFAAVVSAATFGFAPLIGLRGRDTGTLLREGGRATTGGAQRARRALVAVEVALAIVVLCGAGLLIKSLDGLMRVNPGLDPTEVLTLQVSLPQQDTYGPPIRQSFCASLSAAVEGRPGIRSVGAISHLPLSGMHAGRSIAIEGRLPQNAADAASAGYRLTCPGYFTTLGIPIARGRDFTHNDVTHGEKVAIINRAMADTYWLGEDALGRRFKLGSADNDNPWLTIVGIVDNTRHFGLDREVLREFYAPYSQSAWPVMTVVAKTVGEPLSWQTAMRQVIRQIDPDLPVARVQSMEQVVGSSVSWRETPMRLLSAFAIVGMLLASTGVYAVLAYFVAQRTREIGLRAALGATRRQLSILVIRQSMAPIVAGAALGIAGSLASGRLLQEFLYQVQPGDPQVIAVIALLLIVVGLLASWLPARRAAGIDPSVALRDD
jgi:putative ABC transport system permease protein